MTSKRLPRAQASMLRILREQGPLDGNQMCAFGKFHAVVFGRLRDKCLATFDPAAKNAKNYMAAEDE